MRITSLVFRTVVSIVCLVLAGAAPLHAQTIRIGIGTQNMTTNTVTAGIVLKELGLLEKHLPTTGKYENAKYDISWQNFTSGPPITNGMMADNLQIGMMGDYPLLVNGATGQATGNESQLVAVIAYNAVGGGNGIVVPKDSPYYQLEDLKGKRVSVPFGSAAHGMMLHALQSRGLPTDFWNLVSQSPEVGTTNIQEKRIDAHGDFVPFAELLPFRGFARKIYDGAETGQPTFHGVVVRKDFGERYPEVVVAYIRAMMEANDWVRQNPALAAQKIAEWTKIPKEVIYIFLGPDGIHTLDPTIKPRWIEALEVDYGVLGKLGMIKELDLRAWVNDSYVREAYQQAGLDYEAQLQSLSNYAVRGTDSQCNVAVDDPRQAGEVWVKDGDVLPFSSPLCTLAAVNRYVAEGNPPSAVYLVDRALGIKVFANEAFYTIGGGESGPREVVPYLLRRDAEQRAAETGAQVASYEQTLALVGTGER